jgi:hypothetical protein
MLHESEVIKLMRRVSNIFQTKHKCSAEYSDWRVANLSVADLQFIEEKNERKQSEPSTHSPNR